MARILKNKELINTRLATIMVDGCIVINVMKI